MNASNQDPGNSRLGALLRESRPTPTLPPRFQEAVWRRIEKADSKFAPGEGRNWLAAIAGWVLRPRFAFAAASMLVAAGILLGSLNGAAQARHEAQERYLASVAMSVAP